MTDNPVPSCGWLKPQGKSHEVLLKHLPSGVGWLAFRTPGKNFYLLFRAFSNLFEDAWIALCRLTAELDPRTTTNMITEWETAVGLPDPCLPRGETLEERRSWVMWRLEKRRWTTANDWHDLAAIFGLTISITPGWYIQKPSLYPVSYPSLYLMPKLGRFRVYIDIDDGCNLNGYPYSYAASYGFESRCNDFRCLLERICPAPVIIIWNDTPAH